VRREGGLVAHLERARYAGDAGRCRGDTREIRGRYREIWLAARLERAPLRETPAARLVQVADEQVRVRVRVRVSSP